jgi:hypothetical protein
MTRHDKERATTGPHLATQQNSMGYYDLRGNYYVACLQRKALARIIRNPLSGLSEKFSIVYTPNRHYFRLTFDEDLALAAPLSGGKKFCAGSPIPPPAKDDERLGTTLAGLHYLAFVILMLANLVRRLAQS